MPLTWRSSLTFSARLSNVTEILFAYRCAVPLSDLQAAKQEAKVLEEEAYCKARSLEAYNELCKQYVHSFRAIAPRDSPSAPNHEIPVEAEGSRPAGEQIGKYTNATYLANGLSSVVYKTWSPDAQLVALKIVNISQKKPPHDSEREARILSVVAGPNIIPLLETVHEPGSRFILVFPFMNHDMGQLLQQRALSPQASRRLLRDMFTALAHLHSLGIIHRDIKPSNMLSAGPDGPNYLADFGIAWSPTDWASEAREKKITDVGTTCYRPPELLFGNESYTCAVDLWAAGCVVAEAARLTDQTLFDAGELGSELALIQSIFLNLGTPTLDVWPEAISFRDWGKMVFYRFPRKSWQDILPEVSADARDLVSKLVCYESGDRLSAAEALKHPFLQPC